MGERHKGIALVGTPDAWVIPLTVLAGVVSAAVAIGFALRLRGRVGGSSSGVFKTAEGYRFTCTICHRELVFREDMMASLSAAEMGLVVRSLPDVRGRPLVEYVCPHCDADHCFAGGGPVPEWVGVNLYSPQKTGANCMECRKPLANPPWEPGRYSRLDEAPEPSPDLGVVCSRCGAVVCLGCATAATRAQTQEGGALKCPRCFRYSVATWYFH